MSDETIKRIYNTLDETHQNPVHQQDLDYPVLGGVDKLDISPADRHILEEEYSDLTGLIDSYQMTVEHVNAVAENYNDRAEAATEPLPDDMVRDGLSTQLVYEKDGQEERILSRQFFRHIEENLRGQDERMLADYVAQELEDGEAMVASWEDTADDWNHQLYAAAEEHDLTDSLYTVRTVLGQYKDQGNLLRRELETKLETDDDDGWLDKLQSLNPLAGGDLYY